MDRFWILKNPDAVPCFAPIEPHLIEVPLFEISSNPTIPLSEVRDLRFNLIESRDNLLRGLARANVADRVLRGRTNLLAAIDDSWENNSEMGSVQENNLNA